MVFDKLRERLRDRFKNKGALRERLRTGLSKTRTQLAGGLRKLGVRGRKVDEALLEEVEELLVGADLGLELAEEIVDKLRREARGTTIEGVDDLVDLVRASIVSLLPEPAAEPMVEEPPRVTLIVGVNGSGKTTTTGKLAARLAGEGEKVVVAAADTFRAAAVEQLVTWAERAGAEVVRSSPGSDPAAVAFDAARAARARGAGRLLVDTAGRLHTKKPLMDELSKISRAVAKEVPGAPHETLLVLDGTTGRNAVYQAREFSNTVPVNGLVLTKLDGTARGGVAVAIGRELGLPVRYVGVGESIDDLLDFDAEEYISGLLGLGNGNGNGSGGAEEGEAKEAERGGGDA